MPTDPGFEEDLIVTAKSRAIAEWHLGRTSWSKAVMDGAIEVAGSPSLARALPTWNKQSGWARIDTARPQRTKRETPA